MSKHTTGSCRLYSSQGGQYPACKRFGYASIGHCDLTACQPSRLWVGCRSMPNKQLSGSTNMRLPGETGSRCNHPAATRELGWNQMVAVASQLCCSCVKSKFWSRLASSLVSKMRTRGRPRNRKAPAQVRRQVNEQVAKARCCQHWMVACLQHAIHFCGCQCNKHSVCPVQVSNRLSLWTSQVACCDAKRGWQCNSGET